MSNNLLRYFIGGTMGLFAVSEGLQKELLTFLKKNKQVGVVSTYLYFLAKKFGIHPVVFLREKLIYLSEESLLAYLEEQGRLYRETEIKVQYGKRCVNEATKKIYICPFTGKVFGDNTHPHPQDAIYEWVANCPENKELVNGVKSKRFLVSEDPEMIKTYQGPVKAQTTKLVFSSPITGKLFASRRAILEDFRRSQLKSIALEEVPNQNRYQMQEELLAFVQGHLDKISQFVDALSLAEGFEPYVQRWLEEEREEDRGEEAADGFDNSAR